MSFKGLLSRKGAAVTFTKTTPGTVDPNTDMMTAGVTVTVTGHAMKIAGDPDLYKALSLIESESPTLLFYPDTPGLIPSLGMTVVWGSDPLIVKNVNSLEMAGTATAARLVVSK